LEVSRAFFTEPHTFVQLFTLLGERFPGRDVRALGYSIRLGLPLVGVPSDARWSFPAAPARFVLAEEWIGRKVRDDGAADDLVRGYLRALGPATIADIASWTGLRSLRPVIERLRPGLVTFKDEDNKELFDLPDAPRPPDDAPAPVRFLPEFDNVVLCGKDRRRFLTDEQRRIIFTNNLAYAATFTVDGMVAGSWRVVRTKK